MSWEKKLKPLLKQKYPQSSEEDLKKANAFVYGGSIIHDLGYVPMGNTVFSNLLHYVRTGDFINALFDEARDLNEYAFALGALCHYQSDIYGHSLGTNKAVAISFPRIKKKYGSTVSFEKAPIAHVRVEFGFDVLQTAKGNYKPDQYHDFIGFRISDSCLARAFIKTYGIELKSVFRNFSSAVAFFRWTVASVLPELTRDAWKINKSFITQLNPLSTEKNYTYRVDKKKFKKENSGFKPQSLLVTLVIASLPKYGPLAKFKPKIPTPETEKVYEQSFDSIVMHYSLEINRLRTKKASFANINIDTGNETTMGEYKLGDETYYKLLMKLKKNEFKNVDEQLKEHVAGYFSQRSKQPDYKESSHKEKKLKQALAELGTTSLHSQSSN